jgi:hypothetical protein
LVDYGEFYVKNFPLIYLSVNIDGNISLVYTERIIVGKEWIKKPQKYGDV